MLAISLFVWTDVACTKNARPTAGEILFGSYYITRSETFKRIIRTEKIYGGERFGAARFVI
jgi:hypothetical protein